MIKTSLLDRPVYGVGEAAGLLGLRTDRVRAWLDRYERQGRSYAPVVRIEPTGEEIVTWGEFVELGYLREYRKAGVSLQRLRPVIGALRDEYGTEYPLATAQPYLFRRDLLLKLQEANQVPTELAVVVVTGQVISLAGGAQRFFRKVEFNPTGGDAVRLLPAGQASPVSIDPLHNFGRPSVRGVATERLWELFEAGDSVNEIADGYDLERHEVGAAVAYEEQLRTLAA